MKKKYSDPRNIRTYFRSEKKNLRLIALTGILYNVGLLAGPWFEGRLAQCLYDIFHQTKTASDMGLWATVYVLVIGAVQIVRYFQGLYIRKCSSHVGFQLKERVYANLLHRSAADLADTKEAMTASISDARSFTNALHNFITQLFDHGIALLAYLIMMFVYDWRLSLVVCVFFPLAYIASGKSKARGRSAASNTFEDDLQKNVVSNIRQYMPKVLYFVISMIGILFILWLGGLNVIGQGWRVWNIAVFATYLSYFIRMHAASSKIAPLYAHFQQTQLLWKRMLPYLNPVKRTVKPAVHDAGILSASDAGYTTPEGIRLFREMTFRAQPGEIIGITGEKGCGKSTLGRSFLYEIPYSGSIRFDGIELSDYYKAMTPSLVGYMSSDRELFSGTIEENICMGVYGDISQVLQDVCLDQDISDFANGIKTRIGTDGIQLTDAQKAKISLARTLYHARPILVLDDPFSDMDVETEHRILSNLRSHYQDRVILLIADRISSFSKLDQVLWMENGSVTTSNHMHLQAFSQGYRNLFEMQTAEHQTANITEDNKEHAVRVTESLSASGSDLAQTLSSIRDRISILRSIHRQSRNYSLLLTTLIVAILVSVTVSVLPPLILAQLVNRLSAGRGGLLQPAFIYFLLIVLAAGSAAIRNILIDLFAHNAGSAVRSDLSAKLSRLDETYFDTHDTDAVYSSLDKDVTLVEKMLSSGLLRLVSDLLSVLTVLIVVIRLSRGLGVLLMISMPIVYMLTHSLKTRSAAVRRRYQKAVEQTDAQVEETIRNIRIVHLLHCQPFMMKRYHKQLLESMRYTDRSGFYDSIYTPITKLISALLIADMMILAVSSSSMGRIFGMSVGTVIALMYYVSQSFEPLKNIENQLQYIQSASTAMHRIRSFMEEKEKEVEAKETQTETVTESESAISIHTPQHESQKE